MNLLKAQLARLQQQLSGLTASQKMLSAALVAIMAMTLVWWARYSAAPEFSPLLDQSFSQDDIAQITPRLDAKGISYTVSGDRILISASRKTEVLADLSFNHLLPSKMNTAFDEIAKQMTPWDSETKDQKYYVEITQRELSSIIGGYPNVREANVMIDPSNERRFDGHDIVPTAMVNIVTSGQEQGANLRKIATSAAATVASAVAGLSRGKVSVIIDGATIPVTDNTADGGWSDSDTVLQSRRQSEEMYRQKVLDYLGYIKGRVFVSVSVDPITKAVDTHTTKYDTKTSAQLPITVEDHSTESTNPLPSAEAGAVSNLTTSGALSAAGGGGGGGAASTSTETTSKQTNDVRFGQTVENTIQPPGDAPPIRAAVRVPRSYFVNTYKDEHKGENPDDAALLAWTNQESDKILKDVQNCTNITAAEMIVVNSWDDGDAVSGPIVAPIAAPSPVAMILGSHVREMGVGALAVVSLFMVMMMVRKSAPIPLPAEPVEESGDRAGGKLQSESMIAGEVNEGDKTMDGMELDDDAVKTQQVVEQVSAMVAENPDAAANLVKRWLNRA